MHARMTPRTEFAQVVAAGQVDAFDQAVQAAYASGVTHDNLRTAAETGGRLGNVSDLVVTQAYLTVYYWSWMAAREARGDHALGLRAA